MENRPKLYFDSETRRIRRASIKISTLCRFEENSESLVTGLLSALKELNRGNK